MTETAREPISPTLMKFAELAQRLKEDEHQHLIAYENGMDDSARRDAIRGYERLETFHDELAPGDVEKYTPFHDELRHLFKTNIESHGRAPGVTEEVAAGQTRINARFNRYADEAKAGNHLTPMAQGDVGF
ncbi:hypothetical protein HN935_02620 [archaeon]|jgi:hypothetical protein|nr:hypothetical protein [archaeon]